MVLENPNAALPDQGFEVLATAPVLDPIHVAILKITRHITCLPYCLWEGAGETSDHLICSPVHYVWVVVTHKDRRGPDHD